MKSYNIFKEYIWLVQTIHRHKKIDLEGINSLWRQTDMSGGVDFSRTTFCRHKDAIQDIFGIYIECDRKNGYKYYIGNAHVLEGESVQNWMLSTLSVNNLITESMSVQDRILLEVIPDSRYLSVIIHAMKQNKQIEVLYKRFESTVTRTLTFDPYLLKVYHQRWYVLGHFERPVREGELPTKRKGLPSGYIEYYGMFAFDRIKDVKTLDRKFKMNPEFDAKDFFSDCYGIVHNDGIKLERVVLRAFGTEADNMRTLPLHHTQRELTPLDNNGWEGRPDYADFELYLRPSLDFCGKILSRGAWVKVLQPAWLRSEIIEMHRQAIEQYEEENE